LLAGEVMTFINDKLKAYHTWWEEFNQDKKKQRQSTYKLDNVDADIEYL